MWQHWTCMSYSRFSVWGPSADSWGGKMEPFSSITLTKLPGNNPILSPKRPLHQPSSNFSSTSTVCGAHNHRHHSHSSQLNPHTPPLIFIITEPLTSLLTLITTYTSHTHVRISLTLVSMHLNLANFRLETKLIN